MSLVTRKPAFCICENKGPDQLRGNRKADQRLCFSYIDSIIPLLSIYEISSLWPSSVAVQPGLFRTWSETPKTGFSHNEAHMLNMISHLWSFYMKFIKLAKGLFDKFHIKCSLLISFTFLIKSICTFLRPTNNESKNNTITFYPNLPLLHEKL